MVDARAPFCGDHACRCGAARGFWLWLLATWSLEVVSWFAQLLSERIPAAPAQKLQLSSTQAVRKAHPRSSGTCNLRRALPQSNLHGATCTKRLHRPTCAGILHRPLGSCNLHREIMRVIAQSHHEQSHHETLRHEDHPDTGKRKRPDTFVSPTARPACWQQRTLQTGAAKWRTS